MDDIHIGCRTEERIFATHLGGQLTDFSSQIVVHCSVLLGEVAEEDRVRLYTLQRDEGGDELLGDDVATFLAHSDLDVRDTIEMVRGIDEEDGVRRASLRADPLQLLTVVVANEQEVDAHTLVRQRTASILEVIGVVILQPGVHQHDEEIGLLALLDEGYPVCSRGEDIVKVQAFPEMGRYPLRDGRCREA